MGRPGRLRALVAALVLVAACGTADEPAEPTDRADPAEPAEPDPGSDPPAAADADELESPGVEEVDRPEEVDPAVIGPASRQPRDSDDYPRWGADTVQLVDARHVALVDLDRLVLEFDGPVPSWRLRAVTPPVVERPGRQEVDLAGDAFVEVWLVPATSVDRGAREPTAAYRGPSHLAGGDGGLLEAALTGDHSDILVWTLGLQEAADVAIGVLEDPDRVVIDVVPGPG